MQTDKLANDTEAFASGEICRVGGFALTRRALELSSFAPAAHLADIGCGKGATVRYLRALGFEACGLDCDAAAIRQAGPFCQTGDALSLPYAAASLDGLLYECSLSRMAVPQALAEAWRVLKPNGKIVVSDLYAQDDSGGLLNQSQWLELFVKAGFSCLIFEDHSRVLKELAAQLLWQHGRSLEEFHDDVFVPKVSHCSYFLLIGYHKCLNPEITEKELLKS